MEEGASTGDNERGRSRQIRTLEFVSTNASSQTIDVFIRANEISDRPKQTKTDPAAAAAAAAAAATQGYFFCGNKFSESATCHVSWLQLYLK